MRIGIDASLASRHGTGTGRYAAQLLTHLIALDRSNEYVLYFDGRDRQQNPLRLAHAPHVRIRVTRAPSTLARLHVNLPLWLRRDRIDLYHSLGFFLPWLWRGKAVVTIHDIHTILFPQYWRRPGTRVSYLALRAHIPLSIRQAGRILTPSEYTRQTIRDRFAVPPERVAVAAAAADPVFFAPAADAELQAAERRVGRDRYFLYVGAFAPLKNLAGLIEAFARLRRGPAGRSVRLVLVGSPVGRHWERTLGPLIQRLGVDDAVVRAGYVDDATLRALYRKAVGVILPSFAEGFGFPVVEAMACGTAVVISRTPALCEVAGAAALAVDPHDPGELTSAMERLLTEPDVREALVARGRRRVESFSWQDAVRRTLEAYQQA